jgi:hypothetical protein
MTIRRTGSGWVDDARTCLAPGCAMPAPAEPWQHAWPQEVAIYRANADLLMNTRRPVTVVAGPNELLRRADALEARIKVARKEPAPAWLCPGHRAWLDQDETSRLRLAWAGGRHDSADVETIEAAVAFLEANPVVTPTPTKPKVLSSSEQRVAARLARLERQPA